MWYEIGPEDISKRVLTTDDAQGVCAIYPPARVAPVCAHNSPDDGCGCAVVSGVGGSPLLAGSLAAFAWAVTGEGDATLDRCPANPEGKRCSRRRRSESHQNLKPGDRT
jgi:hypothetical protein